VPIKRIVLFIYLQIVRPC